MRANQARRRVRLSVVLLLSVAFAACGQRGSKPPEGEAHKAAAAEFERGPHRGRLLRDGDRRNAHRQCGHPDGACPGTLQRGCCPDAADVHRRHHGRGACPGT